MAGLARRLQLHHACGISGLEPLLNASLPESNLTDLPHEGLHLLPELPYDYTALEPCISAATLHLHHGKHHAGYVEKLNAALAEAPALQDASALWLLCNLDKVPAAIRDAVHHNAGGHVNHSLFWRAMRAGPKAQPAGLLHDALQRDFGDFEAFQAEFEKQGAALFGSGWVWLVRDLQNDDRLEVITTSGHDHPMMQGRYPLLLNDVWEHAYYLQYENRRAEYLKAWWSVVDWGEAARRFERKENFSEETWEAEGGNPAPQGA